MKLLNFLPYQPIVLKDPLWALPHPVFCCHGSLSRCQATWLRVTTNGLFKDSEMSQQVFLSNPDTFCFFFLTNSYGEKAMTIKTHKLYGPSHYKHSTEILNFLRVAFLAFSTPLARFPNWSCLSVGCTEITLGNKSSVPFVGPPIL